MSDDVRRRESLGQPATLTPDPTERVDLLVRHLRTSREGLSSREAERRLVQYGANELIRVTSC
jgi:hypothetical protein